MNKYNQIKSNIIEKLGNRYKIREDNDTLIASRTYFSWKGLVVLSQHIIIKYSENPTISEFGNFFDYGFKKAKSINKVPLFRGFQFGYMIIPCIMTEHISEEVVKHVTLNYRNHFALHEFPVLYNLSDDKVYYYEKTPLWGAFFFSDLRDVVDKYIKK